MLLSSAVFEYFKAKHNKVFNVDDGAAARAAYGTNIQRVAVYNTLDMGFELGKTQFSDLTQEQYRMVEGLGYKAPESTQGF